MSTPSSTSFVAPTSSPDAVAVLVLIESSGMMHSLWDNIRAYYLPSLLNSIRPSNPAVAVRRLLAVLQVQARAHVLTFRCASAGRRLRANRALIPWAL